MNSTRDNIARAGRKTEARDNKMGTPHAAPIIQALGAGPPMPNGLQRLIAMGNFLSSPSLNPPNNLRVTVTVPTKRLAAVAITLGALQTIDMCTEMCNHVVTETIPSRSAAYVNGEFRDGKAYRRLSGEVFFEQSRFTKTASNDFRKSIHLLPAGFPTDRPSLGRSRYKDEIEDFAQALGCDSSTAGLRRSIASAHPVLVVGYVDGFKADVAMGNSPLDPYHPLGCCGVGALKSGWFRHPTLLAGHLHQPDENSSWVRDVFPRLVITVGSAAFRASTCGLWPNVPVVLVLSRREPASVTAVDRITDDGWSPCWPDSEQAKEVLSPGSGIEVGCWTEEYRQAPTYESEDSESEW